MQGVKRLALRWQLSLQYSFPSLGLPLFRAEGLSQALSFSLPLPGGRGRRRGACARVAGSSVGRDGTARCQEVRSLPSGGSLALAGRRAEASPFPAVCASGSEHWQAKRYPEGQAGPSF